MQETLKQERAKIVFDVRKVKKFLYGADLEPMQRALESLAAKLPVDPNIFNEGRIQMIKEAIRQQPHTLSSLKVGDMAPLTALFLNSQFQIPGSVHYGMFILCLKILGSEELADEFHQRCRTCEVLGCYAQTEIGHGSDVQSLMTTATFDSKTDEIVLNTPCIEAIKFWPGDLGIFANYAIVFAKLIVDGHEQGVHSFLLRIRDDNMQPMPGIQCGDIGPKYGYLTKDNGYLKMNNVRIPRRYMLSRVVGLTRDGSLQVKGNPKIVYATMMLVRRVISATWPRMYAQSITISCRYSMFRKQFRDQAGKQQAIIDYQLQQNKLIPLLAEYFAITITGRNISRLTDDNFKRMTENNDDSLMAQTHATLCYGKAYFSDIVQRGLEISRLACGGHGFSQYSGLPSIIKEYSPNITHEGENTVMYLQVARYIIKCFDNSIVKKKEQLLRSVRYLQSYEYLIKKKCTVTDPSNWTIQEIRLLLAQSVCSTLHSIQEHRMKNKEVKKQDLNNYQLGLKLVELAILHAAYNTYYAFEQAIVKFPDEIIKRILFDLCLIYGISSILQKPIPLIAIEAVDPLQFNSLMERKQILLKRVRPHLIGLVDGCAIPDYSLKSAIATGDKVYEQMFELAKKNSLNLNGNSIPAANIVKEGLARSRL